MPAALIFDLFGVIARHQAPAGTAALATSAGVPEPTFLEAYWAHRPSYDRGDVTAAAYWNAVGATLGRAFDDPSIERLIRLDLDSWSAVDDEMVALVETVSAEYRTALLSNIPEDLAVGFERRYPWFGCFDVRALSCRIRHAKPDPAAFLFCLAALDISPGDALFVDDRAENIRAAATIGMTSHHFTGIGPLRETLAGLDSRTTAIPRRSRTRPPSP